MRDIFLTEREREILKLIAHGCSNKEITGKLFISPTTLKTHYYHIGQKMDINLTNCQDVGTIRVKMVLRYWQNICKEKQKYDESKIM